jgi:outer membrane murein-binding lipoprotein Lpp
MSVVAKILVVLNLVLAIVFLGAAATFLGAQESWKVKYEEYEVETTKKIDTITAARDLANKRYNDARVEAANAAGEKDKAVEVQRRIEGENEKITNEHNDLLGKYDKLSQAQKDLVATNEKLTNDIKALTSQKDEAIAAKAEAVKAMNDAVTEQRRLKALGDEKDDTIAALEKKITDLGEMIEGLNLKLAAYKDRIGDLPDMIGMEPIKAKVTSVSAQYNIVMLSVGRDDHVKPGYEFTIYRGNEYVGKVVIDRVEKDYCSGQSKKELEKSPIQAGDDATTRF